MRFLELEEECWSTEGVQSKYTLIFLLMFLSNCFHTNISNNRIKTTTTSNRYFTFGSLIIIPKLYCFKKLQRINPELHHYWLVLLVVHHWYQYNEYVLQDKLAQQVHHTDGTKKINLSKEKKSAFLFTYRSNTIHQDFSSSTHINQWLLIGDICNNGIYIGA